MLTSSLVSQYPSLFPLCHKQVITFFFFTFFSSPDLYGRAGHSHVRLRDTDGLQVSMASHV